MSAIDVYRALNKVARSQARPFGEILSLYALERVLGRLVKTPFATHFVLKGGMLLAAYDMRRPTRDIDAEALEFTLDEAHLRTVIEAVAAVPADDGLVLDVHSTSFTTIRDQDEYSGLRASLRTSLHKAQIPVRLDVSTGDPIVPAPQRVVLPGLLGDDLEIVGYPPELVVAEKSVTILQRGKSNTRWRDFVDLRNFARRHTFDAERLLEAIHSVATARQESLVALEHVIQGFPEAAQDHWRVWRAKLRVEAESHPVFADQLADVLAFVGPLFDGEITAGFWDPISFTWDQPVRAGLWRSTEDPADVAFRSR